MKERHAWSWCGAAMLIAGLWSVVGAQGFRAFEAVSIRPEDPRGTTRPSSRVTPERFEIVGAPAWELVARAFEVDKLRVVAPDWTKRERFAIRAVMPAGATTQHIPEMLKTLLEQRFNFKAHVERRPFPVYELVVLPSGHKLREVGPADDLEKPFTSLSGAAAIYDVTSGLPGDQVRTIAAADGAGLYHITSRSLYVTRLTPPNGVRQLDATRITMSEFSQVLGPSVDRPVVDRTGLNGLYEIKTQLPPARLSPAMQALLGDRVDTTPSGVSVSRALEELGLKLERRDAPVDFIVVDRIERPSPD